MAKYTIPNSTVSRKVTNNQPNPNSLTKRGSGAGSSPGKVGSTMSKVLSKAEGHGKVPLNSKLSGNFGRGNADKGSMTSVTSTRGNFGDIPKEPRKLRADSNPSAGSPGRKMPNC